MAAPIENAAPVASPVDDVDDFPFSDPDSIDDYVNDLGYADDSSLLHPDNGVRAELFNVASGFGLDYDFVDRLISESVAANCTVDEIRSAIDTIGWACFEDDDGSDTSAAAAAPAPAADAAAPHVVVDHRSTEACRFSARCHKLADGTCPYTHVCRFGARCRNLADGTCPLDHDAVVVDHRSTEACHFGARCRKLADGTCPYMHVCHFGARCRNLANGTCLLNHDAPVAAAPAAAAAAVVVPAASAAVVPVPARVRRAPLQ